jgi:DNA (cytosine-5)-methyltransferase 1
MSVDTCESLIAFSCKDSGADALEDVAPTLRAMGHDQSHANAGGQVAVAFRAVGQDGFVPRTITPPVCASEGGGVAAPVIFESRLARNGRGALDVVAPPLKAQSGASGRGDGAPLLATRAAVRRLTPRECERLQGFKDDYTLIIYRGKPAADGPRYKAIGNSMAVPCMFWIGARIDLVEQALNQHKERKS